MDTWGSRDDEDAFDFEEYLLAGTRSLVETVRTTQQVPAKGVRSVEQSLDRLRSAVARDPEIEIAEFRATIEKTRALLAHLKGLTDSDITRVTARAHEIVATDLPDVLTLLILARPASIEYWDLARAAHAHLDHLVATTPSREVSRARWLLRAIVPTHAFRDRKLYPSYGRGASRATHVESIAPAGLPGLGKRS